MRRTDQKPTTGGRRWTFDRVWIAVSLTLLAVITLARPAAACAVCYGAQDSSMTAGMNNAILVLLGVVAVVQGGFVALFLSFRHRLRRTRSVRKDLQMKHGGTP